MAKKKKRIYTCEECGSELEIDKDVEGFTCPICKTQYVIEETELKSEKLLEMKQKILSELSRQAELLTAEMELEYPSTKKTLEYFVDFYNRIMALMSKNDKFDIKFEKDKKTNNWKIEIVMYPKD
jgi:uncharacterized Zn finger protein (UPF0148 family)